MADPVNDLLDVITQIGQKDRHSAFCVGTVLQAGGGKLRIKRGGVPLERENLWVNEALDWAWTEDLGGRNCLTPGDRVVLLTLDDQTYYLICKVVRP